MPDNRVRTSHPGVQDARSTLVQALRHLMRAHSGQDGHLPQELREIAAAAVLVEMAKTMERDAVRAARGVPSREGQKIVMTVTGVARGALRHPWRRIGEAVGITAQ